MKNSQVAADGVKAALYPRLFPAETEGINAYAILDGASIPGLLDHLYAEPRPDFVCLYRGELAPDIAEVAPYLVRLNPAEPVTQWILSEGWGQHWGVFALTRVAINPLRRHFRQFLMVKDPAGGPMYFRFYDPRVLRIFLPTCNREELRSLFGPIQAYLGEGETPEQMIRSCLEEGQMRAEILMLASAKTPAGTRL
jgi:hypothetical protein